MIQLNAIIDVGGGRNSIGGIGDRTYSCAILLFLIECSILQTVVSGINHNEYLAQMTVPQCRQDCLKKFDADDLACLQKLDCSICWNSCAPRSTSSQSPLEHRSSGVIDSSLSSPTSSSDASETIQLSVHSMVRDGSLTMADIVWYANNLETHSCLLTWEVYGGGIMGNLLTDTHEAQLSLWPDSKYHIQVMCKNKSNNKMSKSLRMLIDTANAVTQTTSTVKTSSSKPTRTPATTTSTALHADKVEEPSSTSVDANQQPPTTQTEITDNSNNNHHTESIDVVSRKQLHQETTKSYQNTPKDSDGIRNNGIDGTNYADKIRDNVAVGDNSNNDEQNSVVANENAISQKKLSSTVFTTPSANDALPVTLAHYHQKQPISSSSRDRTASAGAKLSKSPKSTWNSITHIQIETLLTVFCLFIVIVALVICTIVSLKQSRKSNKHCDKTNLISRSSSECEMDLSASSSSIISQQTTAMHV